jgi:hypothetical protein
MKSVSYMIRALRSADPRFAFILTSLGWPMPPSGVAVPSNALTLNGQPLTLNGDYLTLGA